jgi:2-polyprenyl-6-methoxyphenol hydroxylase-like FAD-dependent oxidoreductase
MSKIVQRALISGGGIGGLCAAIGLRQLGIDVTVYERTTAMTQSGAGLIMWPNAIRALRKLGLADQIINAGARIEYGALRTATGAILACTQPSELERRFGEPTIAIHRATLHRILHAALPDGVVHFGVSCDGFAQDAGQVTVRLAADHTDQADLFVAADGIHSTIRQQLCPHATLRYAGYTAWRGVVAASDDTALGVTSESWGQGKRFGIVCVDVRRVYWFATANTPPGQTRPASEHKALLLQQFGAWHHPIRRLIEATPAEHILHNDIYDMKPFTPWSRGRVGLLGDAAHPTTPNMGQGACMAIESAVTLARSLAQAPDVTAALHRYEAERHPRTARVTSQSWQIGRVGQLENRLACALRNAVIRLTPARIMQEQVAQVINHEV